MFATKFVSNTTKLTSVHFSGAPSLAHLQKRTIILDPATRNQYVNQYTDSSGRSSAPVVAAVFGCTGFIGRYVCHDLVRSGAQLITPYRKLATDVRHLRVAGDVGQVVHIPYHPADYNSICEIVSKCNVVINLVGRSYERWNWTFDLTNVELPKYIALAAKECGVNRFIHFSALGAAENSPSIFLRSKAKSERVIRDIIPEATIVRPSWVIGHEDKFINFFAKCIRLLPGVPLINRGNTKIQPIYVGNVAAAVAAMVFDRDTEANTYELGGPQVYKVRELIDKILKILGEDDKTRYLPIAPPIAKLIGAVNEHFRQPAWTVDFVDRLLLDNVVSRGALTLDDLRLEATPIDFAMTETLVRWNINSGVAKRFMDIHYTAHT